MKIRFAAALGLCTTLQAGLAWAQTPGSGGEAARGAYNLGEVSQRNWPRYPDMMPASPEARAEFARMLAYDATIYATSAALEYRQMYRQAIDTNAREYTGFNRFAHDRELARPGYAPFRTPNADTLYSNAWLDLTDGPVILTVPATGDRYYTVNFLDIYGNASNISTRTHGPGPNRYAIVAAGWEGEVPEGLERFTVATPYTWILQRVLATNLNNPVGARAAQQGFKLEPLRPKASRGEASRFPAPNVDDADGFFAVADWVIRANGYPREETGLVSRYRALGVGVSADAVAQALADPVVGPAMREGFKAAKASLENSSQFSGYPAGTWKVPADVGAFGFNYVYRAAINTLGTGGNVVEENYPFNTFVDAQGDPLDGSRHAYRLTFDTPPPARFFWSLTMYDAHTRELVPNPIDRFIINDRTPGLVKAQDGSISIAIQKDRPTGKNANWLPAPDGPFYLVIRAQGPEKPLLEGKWLPPRIEKVAQ